MGLMLATAAPSCCGVSRILAGDLYQWRGEDGVGIRRASPPTPIDSVAKGRTHQMRKQMSLAGVKLTTAALLGAAAMALAAPAHADELDTIEAQCQSHYGFPAEVCDCVRMAAEEHLSAEQRKFVVAKAEEDEETMTALSGPMSPEDRTAANSFMALTPSNCSSR